MRYQSRQWVGVALATLFLLSGATARVRAEVPVLAISQFTTTKGCGTNVNYNVGDSFQILFTVSTNATATLTLQRPDGTFTVFSNVALNGGVQYFLDRTVSAADATSTTCGARTLTLTATAGSQTASMTCVYNVTCANVGGAVAVDVHTGKGCGAGATYNDGDTAQVFVSIASTGNFTATLMDIWPDSSQHVVFQNVTLQGGVQYFVTGGLKTTPAGVHSLAFHVVSQSNTTLTGDGTCGFTVAQVAGAIAADVHTNKNCGASAVFTVGETITVLMTAGQTSMATLTETPPGSSTPNIIFQNVMFQAGVQYFVTGTASTPTGTRNLHLHLISTTNSALTGDADCAFTVNSGSVGGTVTVDIHTNKGCTTSSTTVHFAQGEANTIFFTVGRNAIVNISVTRPDGTFTILSNFSATAGVQYFINSSIAAVDGMRTLTLNATATDGTGDTGQGTRMYTVP